MNGLPLITPGHLRVVPMREDPAVRKQNPYETYFYILITPGHLQVVRPLLQRGLIWLVAVKDAIVFLAFSLGSSM
jgi:hypothetical protein